MTDLTMSQFASKDDLIAAQAVRIAELEAQLEAIGAGGVEPLRKQAAAPQAVQAAVPTDDELTMAWIAAGGVFFGPNTPTGSMPEAKLFPFLRQLAATHPTKQGLDTVRELIALHSKELEQNPYAYFELAHTRQTGWCAWITDHPRSMPPMPTVNPDRKVLACGQGDTPEAACAAALAAQAKQGGA